jgi:hypothetical protein
MNLTFNDQKAYLANVNIRAEIHGEEREPAGDLKFELDVANDVLSELHPALKSTFYHYDEARPADLADQGKRDEVGFLPHLRLPELSGPIRWSEEMDRMKLTVRQGKAEIVLSDVKVNNVQFEPRDGGTVAFQFRVQAHPDARAFGALAVLVQTEVTISLEPMEQ